MIKQPHGHWKTKRDIKQNCLDLSTPQQFIKYRIRGESAHLHQTYKVSIFICLLLFIPK